MRRFVLALFFVAGCQDLRDYRGQWTGGLAADPELQHGVACDPAMSPRAQLTIEAVDHVSLRGQLAVTPMLPNVTLESIKRASGDALGEARVGHDALRSYLAFLPTGWLTVVSLFPDERVEVRVISGTDDLYCLFLLRRP
ncbi:MAG TPA: hypothetical protein VKN99_05605 [Polyangia bacterium]|nr:hypothetical protein [Polyangia bacterium]